jgi:hypothetical protein
MMDFSVWKATNSKIPPLAFLEGIYLMDTIEVWYCDTCLQRIKNRNLFLFWKALCLNYIVESNWIEFEEDEDELLTLLQTLEKKGFIMTVDHENMIYSRPNGVYPSSMDPLFLVCLQPELHLPLSLMFDPLLQGEEADEHERNEDIIND